MDFKVTDTFYNRDSIEVGKLTYDSRTGIFFRNFEKTLIKLDEKEKLDIYKYFTLLAIKNEDACVKFEDNTSSKISLVFEKSKNNNNKCTVDKGEIEKHYLLYAKIRGYLRSKKEYEKAFPQEFEEY